MSNRIFEECVHYALKENQRNRSTIWLRQNVLRKFEMPYVEFFITTKCNLKCDKCSNLIPLLEKQNNLMADEFKANLDLFLSKIDRLYRLKIHGGEVFLHPELAKIIEYADKQKKVLSIRITTNGTIIPNEKTLKTLSDSKVVVQISNYDISKSKAKQLMDVFQKNKVKYVYLENQKWKDMGDFALREKNRFEECTIKRCTALLDGKIYICSRAGMMAKQNIVKDNGISIFLKTKDFRKEVQEMYNNNALECNYCDGDTCFAKEIKAGEQRK